MMELLEFVFKDFIHFIGSMFILCVLCATIVDTTRNLFNFRTSHTSKNDSSK